MIYNAQRQISTHQTGKISSCNKRELAIVLQVFLLCLIFLPGFTSAQAADTLYSRVIFPCVVTNPSKGENSYTRKIAFPQSNISIRKASLFVKFSCPDSMRCADWDYADQIIVKKRLGAGQERSYTIAQMLTPYGGAFTRDWSFEWQADISDFILFLRDSAEIIYVHSGYEENRDRGWKIELNFQFVTGPPIALPLAIHKVYSGSFQYGNTQYPIDSALKSFDFHSKKLSEFAHVFLLQSGHGMDSSGCGEFCSKFREIWWNGKMISKKEMWKQCGANPLFPQAGTWIFDRANWCPGYLNQPDITKCSILRQHVNSFQVRMEPYQTKDANVHENIFAYVIEYAKPRAKRDISIDEVLVPSEKQIYGRMNPAASRAVVIIRNNGRFPLEKCVIKYGTEGFPAKEFHWKGKLLFDNATEVQLPGVIESHKGENRFRVEVLFSDGQHDEYPGDNIQISNFKGVPRLGNTFIIQMKTNHHPSDNSYIISNDHAAVVYYRPQGSLKADSIYMDTVRLPDASYRLELTDTAGNGLEFWYANKQGRGFFRILNERGEMVKCFDADFGSHIKYDFIVDSDCDNNADTPDVTDIAVFPTLTSGPFRINYQSNLKKDVMLSIVVDGGNNEVAEEHHYYSISKGIFNYDMSYLPPQRYYVKVYINGKLSFNKRLRVVPDKTR